MDLMRRGCSSCGRRLSTSAPFAAKFKMRKKDPYYEAKLPVWEYTKINADKNRLYVFGTAWNGSIGLENLIKPKNPEQKTHLFMWKPVRHKFAEFHDMTDLVAGHGFSLFAIKPRVERGPFIFGCGRNNTSQLGYHAVRKDAPMETLLSIVPLPFFGSKKGSEVLALGAGKGHSLISVKGEGLYSLGDNERGQCGRTVIPDEIYFGSKYIHKHTRFEEEAKEIVQIAARFDMSVCVTRSGEVYTCGDNEKGQLGRGKVVPNHWELAKVGGDLEGEMVTKVVTSGSTVLALTDKGEVFSWGCNEYGQADPDKFGTVTFYPHHVKLPSGIGKVTDIAMGDFFSFILNQQGNVYVWGAGPCLGLGPDTKLVKVPTMMPPPLFGCNKFTPNVQVVGISSSFYHAAAINSEGDLYTWGKDLNGCLGLGKMDIQHFPLRVGLGASAKKISLGIDHTVVLARAH